MAASGNILSATPVRPARGVTAQPAGERPGIAAVAVPGQEGPAGRDGAAAGSPVFVASVALGGHRVVRALANGTVAYASADDPDALGTVVGLTLGAAVAGADVTVQSTADLTEPSWAWSPGPVWLGIGGALTQVLPVLPGAVFRQYVGLALSPTRILVALGAPIVLA